MSQSSALHRQMIACINRFAPSLGYTQSSLFGVRFMRADHRLKQIPVLYEPSIVIVCQGQKVGYLANKTYHYDAQQYMVLSVPLPFVSETYASEDEPLLAISISLDFEVISQLLLSLEHHQIALIDSAPESIMSTPLEQKLLQTTVHLLAVLDSPTEAELLGPAIIRELFYRVLIGPRGGALKAAMSTQSQFGRIAKVLKWIHREYASHLNVALLSSMAGLSEPAFYRHFKAVTHLSPIQYIKAIRLHQARLLMIRDNMTSAGAALRVGYESASQFNREFKRFFGRTPGHEKRQMQTAFSLHPPVHFEQLLAPH